MVRNRSKWFRSTMTQSRFSSVSYSKVSQSTDNLDHRAVANEFVSKRAMQLSCAVLMKFLKIYKKSCFSALQITIIIKCTQRCFSKSNLFEPSPLRKSCFFRNMSSQEFFGFL